MDIPGRRYSYSKLVFSKNFRKEYSFLLCSKGFIALYVFIYSALYISRYFFFYVFDGFLENTLHLYLLSLSTTTSLESNLFFHPNRKKKRFLDVSGGGELIKG